MTSAAYLIRHSLTEANEKRLYCGKTDLPLSKDGISLAMELKRQEIYKLPEGCKFFTSGMRRTDETLRLLFGEVNFTKVPELREIDFGSFEMLSYAELKDREDYKLWLKGDNEKNPCPHGESAVDMEKRVIPAIRAIFKEKSSVTVTHGGVIACIMAQFFPHEGKNRYQWQPAPAEGYRLLLKDSIPVGYEWLHRNTK
ncbi:MAG: histidine phosphatase family protein [Clostridiales bacterium]|nr:histidine phosphatase family protein [Clostridiales bacterium]